MSKIPYPSILVVEGASDEALLRSFLDADIVTTNGSEVSRETIDFLKQASKTRSIVVLTDPDSPGKRIRDLIAQEVPNVQHAFVRKEKSIKHHKVGVAESSKDEVLLALSHLVPAASPMRGNLTNLDLIELGLSGCPGAEEKRKRAEEELHLGHGNAKTFLKRANALNLSKEDIERVLS